MRRTKLVVHVVGARPNYMKIAPVYAALERRGVVEQRLVHTGQHYDREVADAFFDELPLPTPHAQLTVGSGIFVVVVVGCMGSLAGAFLASLLIGVVQTFAVALDYSLAGALRGLGIALSPAAADSTWLKLTVAQVAPILPYLFLVLILIFRPKGLLGTRDE